MNGAFVLPAGDQLRDRAVVLAEAVVACEFERDPRLRARYGPIGRAGRRRDAVDHLLSLADAVDSDSPAVFEDYIGWAQSLWAQRGAPGDEMARTLDCIGDVVQAQMPGPVAAAAATLIDGARRALPPEPAEVASFLDPRHRLSALAGEYLHALLGGYRQGAGQLVLDAADRGEPVADLYLQVLQPALWEIGRLWQMQKISVAQEHFCSAATQLVMAQLLPRASRPAHRAPRIVVACVRGDRHDIGARMVSDFFEMAGWDSIYCGADTPHEDLVRLVVARRAPVLAISASIGRHLHTVKELIEDVRAEPQCAGVHVLVGGRPFQVDPALWRKVGADGTAADAAGAVQAAAPWRDASVAAHPMSGPPPGHAGPTPAAA